MKLINRDTDYAIRALAYIAKCDKKIVSVTDLQKELKIPRPFLRKILQILQRSDVLLSLKGNKGGFKLEHSPKDIFVSDIIKIFQGDVSFTNCLLKTGFCPDIKKCVMRKKIKELEKMVVSELRKTTIASLL